MKLSVFGEYVEFKVVGRNSSPNTLNEIKYPKRMRRIKLSVIVENGE
jgi:hypothetical protein